MSFLFNFQNTEDTDSPHETNKGKEDISFCGTVQPCEEIFPLDQQLVNKDLPVTEYKISKQICVRCLQSRAVEEELCEQPSGDSGTVQAARSHSDLIPNVYEGGLKVWECAIDLAEYLLKESISFQDKTVAELGCGAGVPGIVAVMAGAAEVHFQDYNKEVIEHYTIPNVSMNTKDSCRCKCRCKCRYFGGDWDAFRNCMAQENISYDIILTAETIYRQENYPKLSKFFKNCLKPSGMVYLAAKSNYFGVGGGTSDFVSFLDREGRFCSEICCTVGKGLPREIWKIVLR